MDDKHSGMEVVVGTYDELLLAYRIIQSSDGYQFEQSFTNHTHTGCIKAASISEKGILASGSSDETIKLFNLRSRRELGSLIHHNGSITCLKYHKSGHMFSCSEDGTVVVWKTRRWDVLRALKGHKGAVYNVAVHPTGKMALSVGADKTLRTWNLITGKCAYITNIKQVGDLVSWSPEGDHYVTVSDRQISVYQVETAEVCHSVTCASRVQDMEFIQPNVLLIATGGDLECHNIITKEKVHTISTGTTRVRGLQCCQCPTEGSNSQWVFTASSDGLLQIWDLSCSEQGAYSSKLVTKVDTTFRLTCLAMYEGHESTPDAADDNEEATSLTTEQAGSPEEDSEEGEEDEPETKTKEVPKPTPRQIAQAKKKKRLSDSQKQKKKKRKH